MIHSVSISGFKRFRDHTFQLKRLTVLAGRNGSGKTSVIQSILLTREALLSGDTTVALNGPYGMALGTFDDVANGEDADGFSIELGEGAETFGAKFSQPEKPAQQFYVHFEETGEAPVSFIRQGRSFQYLGAERIGPRLLSTVCAVPQESLGIGHMGENAAQLIEALGANNIPEMRRFDINDKVPLLKSQTELWLSALTRPVQIDTETYPNTPVVTLKYRTDADWLAPTNMGFGVTYALPIVVAALSTDEGGILVVENPEAHLAPAGQTQMGMFLAKIAASGVQVIVETHSDHFINGVRRAIGEMETLDPDDAIIHFLDGEATDHVLSFTHMGGISHWPKGFFDQFQIDVAALTRIRRKSF